MGGCSLSTKCEKDLSSCTDLTFDSWAYDQVERASACEKANSDENLWPSCGDTGLFGGLYSQQIEEYLSFFNASQIAVVPMEAYPSDAPQLLTNLGSRRPDGGVDEKYAGQLLRAVREGALRRDLEDRHHVHRHYLAAGHLPAIGVASWRTLSGPRPP